MSRVKERVGLLTRAATLDAAVDISLTENIYTIYFIYMRVGTYITIDQGVKHNAQRLASNLGLSLSTVINAQLKQFVRDKHLILTNKPREMSPELERLLATIESDIRQSKNLTHTTRNKKELRRLLAGV